MPEGDRVWRERGLRSAVLAGDEQAWRAWYEESFAGLDTFVRWRCAGRQDWADDIIQETWLVAVRRIRSFDPVRGSFADWLRGIAANLLRNQLRKRRPTPSLNGVPKEMRESSSPALHESHNQDRSEQIALALSQLPERYEVALRAKYLDRQSVAQMADAWHETPKAIESLLTRARESFRQEYQRLEDGGEPS
jgi:RNA polymerase sigma-70 factor, ECF subfamily